MNKKGIGMGALVGGLLTAPLIALMFLANTLFDLTFVPFDVFNWMTRVLPGPVITFGIDAMIDLMRFLGISVANFAKTAEMIMAVGQYLVLGIIAGAVYFAVLRLQQVKASLLSGVVIGALFGFPAVAISIAMGDIDKPDFQLDLDVGAVPGLGYYPDHRLPATARHFNQTGCLPRDSRSAAGCSEGRSPQIPGPGGRDIRGDYGSRHRSGGCAGSWGKPSVKPDR